MPLTLSFKRHWYIPTNCCVIDMIAKLLVWIVSDAIPLVCAVISTSSFVQLYDPDVMELGHDNIMLSPNRTFLTTVRYMHTLHKCGITECTISLIVNKLMFYHLKISCYIRNLHAIDNNIMPIGTLLTIKVHHIVAYEFNILMLKFNLYGFTF